MIRIGKILILFLVFVVFLFASAERVQAGSCYCIDANPTGIGGVGPKGINDSLVFSICEKGTEIPTSFCKISSMSCSCGENPSCGHSTQEPCHAINPLLKSSVETTSVVVSKIAPLGLGWLMDLLTGVSSTTSNDYCAPGLQAFKSGESLFCALSQSQADEFEKQKQEFVKTGGFRSFQLCKQAGNAEEECKACFTSKKGIWTAIGCIPFTKESIVVSFVRLGIGIAGGVVLLVILGAAFQYSTSKGDPKATEEAREKITSALGGILFIIFSMVLVRTIGIDILKIPGF